MNKRLLWLIVIIILLLSSFNVVPQIRHSLSKKKSTKEEIIAVNKKIDNFKKFLKKKLNEFNDTKVRIVIDIDPVNLM